MKPIRILIVDDENDNCSNLEDILNDQGHQVTSYVDPQQALDDFESNLPIDLALIDWKMPRLDGFQLLERLREKAPDLIAFLVTGYSPTQTGRPDATGGFDAMLEKPLDVVRLLKMLPSVSPPESA